VKKIILLLSVALISLSCNTTRDERKVKRVAQQYLTAFKDLDFDRAKKVGTPGAKNFLVQMEKYVSDLTEEEAIAVRARVEAVKIEIKSVKVSKKHATVRYRFIGKDVNQNMETLYLYKQTKGNWLVDEATQ
jgi:hypothetical protein